MNDAHAKELLSWMFAQDQRGETVLGESRRLKELAAIAGSDHAVAELRKVNNLDQAYVFTSGLTESFSGLLNAIESDIASSIALLGGDMEPDASHVTMVDRIVDNAENLQLLIQKAMFQRKKRAKKAEAASKTND